MGVTGVSNTFDRIKTRDLIAIKQCEATAWAELSWRQHAEHKAVREGVCFATSQGHFETR